MTKKKKVIAGPVSKPQTVQPVEEATQVADEQTTQTTVEPAEVNEEIYRILRKASPYEIITFIKIINVLI